MEATKQLTKHIEAAKAEAISLAKNLAGVLGELKKYGLHFHVTNDNEFKALAVSFGTPEGDAPAPVKTSRTAKAPKSAKVKATRKGKRGGQSEAILAALATTAMTTGEIKEKIKYTGANLSAVLNGIAKAGKIAKNGKVWHVKK